jgi:hypothetical protein
VPKMPNCLIRRLDPPIPRWDQGFARTYNLLAYVGIVRSGQVSCDLSCSIQMEKIYDPACTQRGSKRGHGGGRPFVGSQRGEFRTFFRCKRCLRLLDGPSAAQSACDTMQSIYIYIYISHWRHRTRAGFISLLLRGLHRKMRVLIPLVAAMPLVGCR